MKVWYWTGPNPQDEYIMLIIEDEGRRYGITFNGVPALSTLVDIEGDCLRPELGRPGDTFWERVA